MPLNRLPVKLICLDHLRRNGVRTLHKSIDTKSATGRLIPVVGQLLRLSDFRTVPIDPADAGTPPRWTRDVGRVAVTLVALGLGWPAMAQGFANTAQSRACSVDADRLRRAF